MSNEVENTSTNNSLPDLNIPYQIPNDVPHFNIPCQPIPNYIPDLNIPFEQQHSGNESYQDNVPPEDVDPENIINDGISRKCLTNTQRNVIFQSLLAKSNNGIIKKGAISQVASQFSVNRKAVSNIWSKGKRCMENESTVDVCKNLRARSKRVVLTFDQVSSIPLRDRTTIRRMSTALSISKTTLHRRIKEGEIKAHSNSLKPFLTEDNKKVRLKFCIDMINQGTINSRPLFTDMYDHVHIDEKWFYLTKVSQKYYLHPQEIEPLRTCKSKRFITKVMFLAAVARPNVRTSDEIFSGKIGIFPFIFKEPAKPNSKNRIAGTLETKAIENVNKDVIRQCLIEKVLPGIRTKWPENRSRVIFIQQDNARPHIKPDDDKFLQEARKDGFDIQLRFQPPNSPDLNVLDLGFFRSIQSLQQEQAPTTIDEFVTVVENAFNELTSENLNSVFLTLQSCMIEVIKLKGGINYSIPHMSKERLRRAGQLPECIECDPIIVNQAIETSQE
ncbi:uncharacterized protein LOC126668255 [Mercurialis annua]|uniref:uncharacterized protein LOC126668255 n=1 Tax=Mercurialis annua TaxID=3986 RepID=UPI002160800B|nr:uncharacterized protein LOC126668255 [Mercurialis annua]